MRSILSLVSALLLYSISPAQVGSGKVKPLSLADYEKAKTFRLKDLDNDTYAKIENTYILDRYEMRKPYFITGDDGLKKRIDLYKLISKDDMAELGTVIYYTNEKGKLFTAVQPNFTADPKVWEKYFEDIHSIDKEEKNFVLKLSYVLSKEMSFQLYKALNQGRDLKEEAGTYGTDICFPGDLLVKFADGTSKQLKDVVPGDKVLTLDIASGRTDAAEVKDLVVHEQKNYAITTLFFLSTIETTNDKGIFVSLAIKQVKATPNHPMKTTAGEIPIGKVQIGDHILCFNERTNTYETLEVVNKVEKAGGFQKVYNMVVDKGSGFLINNVTVLQK